MEKHSVGMEKRGVGEAMTSEAKHRQSEAWKDGQRQGKSEHRQSDGMMGNGKAGRSIERLWQCGQGKVLAEYGFAWQRQSAEMFRRS